MRKALLVILVVISMVTSMLVGLFVPIQETRAAALVPLNSAATFTVLAGSTITNTGNTSVIGDLGLSPGSAVNGFPPGTVSGTQHVTDPIAAQAQLDLTTAYNNAAGQTLGVIVVSDGELGGKTLAPGLYQSAPGSFSITSSDLTLDAGGDPSAVWIFQMPSSTLTVGNGRHVVLTNSANAANIFWQVGSSATIGTTAVMNGTIMADQSITLQTGATLNGRALARIGAVTLDTNAVTNPTAPVIQHTIVASAGAGGSISPAGSVIVNDGSSQSFIMTPDAGYHIAGVLVDTVTAPSTSPYTFTNVTADHTIAVSFAINTYTLTYTAGIHGTVTGVSPQTVNYGASGTAVTAVPDPNCSFVQWSDGNTTNPRTDTNVHADITVIATFALHHTITAFAGAGGSISPAGSVIVNDGSSQSFIMTPNAGYYIAGVLVDGVAAPSTSLYTFTNVTADHAIAVSFAANPIIIVSAPNIHLQKTVSPTGTVLPGALLTYTLTYNNTGTASTSVLTIMDVLDNHLNPTGLTIGQAGAYNTANRTITWNVGVVVPGASGTVTFSASVLSTITTSTVIQNTGTYTATTGGAGSSNTVSTQVTPTTPVTPATVVYHHNFFVGYPDKTFKPEGNITRAEFAAALSRALGLGWTSEQPGFKDVRPTHWSVGHITLMKQEGFMVGDVDGNFRPDAPITRGEAAAVFVRIAGIAPAGTLSTMTFTDVKSTFWAAPYIEAGLKAGILAGYPDSTFKPADFMSRAEFATLSCETLGRQQTDTNQRNGLANVVQFPDVSSTYWAHNYIMEVSTPHTVTNPTLLTRVIKLHNRTIPLYSEGASGIITFLKIGDTITAIVPVDGLQSNGSNPAPRQVTVSIITTGRP